MPSHKVAVVYKVDGKRHVETFLNRDAAIKWLKEMALVL
jgi:hypothetical protein